MKITKPLQLYISLFELDCIICLDHFFHLHNLPFLTSFVSIRLILSGKLKINQHYRIQYIVLHEYVVDMFMLSCIFYDIHLIRTRFMYPTNMIVCVLVECCLWPILEIFVFLQHSTLSLSSQLSSLLHMINILSNFANKLLTS